MVRPPRPGYLCLWRRLEARLLRSQRAHTSRPSANCAALRLRGDEELMRVKVDRECCCGCGQCEETCHQVFRVNGEIAEVKVDVVPLEVEDACRQALEGCPARAISIVIEARRGVDR